MNLSGLPEWESSLDQLEERLAREEAALAQGVIASFEAVELPTSPMGESDRIRAMLALDRVRRLELEMHDVHGRTPQPARLSPYA
jgi:hypothetical protein